MTDERILVVGPSWVGDMVMAQSLFKLLQDRYSGGEIDVLAPAWSLPIIARMPEVREGLAANVAHGEFGLRKRRRLGRQLRDRHYSRAIVLPRSWKSALVPWHARVPLRTGFRGEMRFGLINDMRQLDRARLDQTVKRFLALGLQANESPDRIPYPELMVSSDNQQRIMTQLNLQQDRPAVAMMPGAEYGPAKCWPLAHFSSLANQLAERGYAVWIMGSANDQMSGKAIAGAADAVNLCGKTSLEDAIDLLAYCDHAVSNDSGLMHIAAAVGTRVHALYGSSTPVYTPPLTDNSEIHYRGLECSPCFERECPLQHLNCLQGITPQQVLDRFQTGTALDV